jgi:hypothetical protein
MWWLAISGTACGGEPTQIAKTTDARTASWDGGSDAVGGTDGSSDAASDLRFFPYQVGRTWSFTGSQTSQGHTTDASFTTQVVGQQTYDGRSAFVSVTQYIGGTSQTTYVDTDSADETWGEYRGSAGQWLPFTRAPVQDGASWTYSYFGTRVETWHTEGEVTVVAGTFGDCWRIDEVVTESSQPGDINYSILCRGVGTVRTELSLSNGFSLRSELVSKSF